MLGECVIDPRTQCAILPLRYDEGCAQESRCSLGSLGKELSGVSQPNSAYSEMQVLYLLQLLY